MQFCKLTNKYSYTGEFLFIRKTKCVQQKLQKFPILVHMPIFVCLWKLTRVKGSPRAQGCLWGMEAIAPTLGSRTVTWNWGIHQNRIRISRIFQPLFKNTLLLNSVQPFSFFICHWFVSHDILLASWTLSEFLLVQLWQRTPLMLP